MLKKTYFPKPICQLNKTFRYTLQFDLGILLTNKILQATIIFKTHKQIERQENKNDETLRKMLTCEQVPILQKKNFNLFDGSCVLRLHFV